MNRSAVPEAEVSDPEPWFIFNDFVVQNISEEEALSFPSTWKVGVQWGSTCCMLTRGYCRSQLFFIWSVSMSVSV